MSTQKPAVANEDGWEFKIGQKVAVGLEEGVVVGRAEFTFKDDEYFVRVIGGDNLPLDDWWTQSALAHSIVKH